MIYYLSHSVTSFDIYFNNILISEYYFTVGRKRCRRVSPCFTGKIS